MGVSYVIIWKISTVIYMRHIVSWIAAYGNLCKQKIQKQRYVDILTNKFYAIFKVKKCS